MGHHEDEQQSTFQATVQPIPTLGEGCLSRFDPDALNEQQGADFSAAEQLCQQWLDKYQCPQG